MADWCLSLGSRRVAGVALWGLLVLSKCLESMTTLRSHPHAQRPYQQTNSKPGCRERSLDWFPMEVSTRRDPRAWHALLLQSSPVYIRQTRSVLLRTRLGSCCVMCSATTVVFNADDVSGRGELGRSSYRDRYEADPGLCQPNAPSPHISPLSSAY